MENLRIFKDIEQCRTKLNKEFLDCNDLMSLLNLGKNSVRNLMNRKDFPTLKIGKRKLVSISEFYNWVTNQSNGGVHNGR